MADAKNRGSWSVEYKTRASTLTTKMSCFNSQALPMNKPQLTYRKS